MLPVRSFIFTVYHGCQKWHKCFVESKTLASRVSLSQYWKDMTSQFLSYDFWQLGTLLSYEVSYRLWALTQIKVAPVYIFLDSTICPAFLEEMPQCYFTVAFYIEPNNENATKSAKLTIPAESERWRLVHLPITKCSFA